MPTLKNKKSTETSVAKGYEALCPGCDVMIDIRDALGNPTCSRCFTVICNKCASLAESPLQKLKFPESSLVEFEFGDEDYMLDDSDEDGMCKECIVQCKNYWQKRRETVESKNPCGCCKTPIKLEFLDKCHCVECDVMICSNCATKYKDKTLGSNIRCENCVAIKEPPRKKAKRS